MLTLGEYNGAGSGTTKLLLHLNGNSTDSSGNSNSGTDTAITYSLANGKFGQGAEFNGTSSVTTVTLPNALSGSFTWSVWVKTNDNTKDQRILHSQVASYNNYWAILGIQGDVLKKFYCNLYDGTNNPQVITGANVVTTDWFNLVFTRNTIEDKIHLYVNGSEIGTGSTDTTTSVPSYSSLYIGQGQGGIEHFTGAMDEIIVESGAWTPTQVRKYYTFTKGRFGL